MSSSFGNLFRISTWGESHGIGVGVVIDGCPPQIEISEEDIQKELDRRRPGQSEIVTPRKEGDVCEKGSQLRPHIVWFGEMVPMMEVASLEVMKADFLIIVGTSLVVYPAAGLVDFAGPGIPKYLVDPNIPEVGHISNLETYGEPASTGLKKVADKLIALS